VSDSVITRIGLLRRAGGEQQSGSCSSDVVNHFWDAFGFQKLQRENGKMTGCLLLGVPAAQRSRQYIRIPTSCMRNAYGTEREKRIPTSFIDDVHIMPTQRTPFLLYIDIIFSGRVRGVPCRQRIFKGHRRNVFVLDSGCRFSLLL